MIKKKNQIILDKISWGWWRLEKGFAFSGSAYISSVIDLKIRKELQEALKLVGKLLVVILVHLRDL